MFRKILAASLVAIAANAFINCDNKCQVDTTTTQKRYAMALVDDSNPDLAASYPTKGTVLFYQERVYTTYSPKDVDREGGVPAGPCNNERCLKCLSEAFCPSRYVESDTKINASFQEIADGQHGFHIHTFGTQREETCGKTGGHFDPNGVNHQKWNAKNNQVFNIHVGALKMLGKCSGSNCNCDIQGGSACPPNVNAQLNYKDPKVDLWGDDSVAGRSITIHNGVDDLGLGGNSGSLANGNSGPRVGCGNIFFVTKDDYCTGGSTGYPTINPTKLTDQCP